MTLEFNIMPDISPSMWFPERSIILMFEIQLQNQPGGLLEIPD